MSESSFARHGREYVPGDVLFREGESGDVMFVIQSGAVKITQSVEGEDEVLVVLGPGELVGDMAIQNGVRTPGGIRVRTTPEELLREVDVAPETVGEVVARLRRQKLLAGGPAADLVVTDMRRFLGFIEFLETPQKFGGES